jgi:DNA-3-methyladenine glycosylase
VARELLGCVLVHRSPGSLQRVRLVETEAYVGVHDRASHASRGPTPRNRLMFGPPGFAYVYRIYGLHWMLNVVTAAEGDAQAVLLRAAEPLAGALGRLDGPARLTRALGVTDAHHGVDMTRGPLVFLPGAPPERVARGPRVGVDYAGEWAAAPLRFWDADSPAVSRPRGRAAALARGRPGRHPEGAAPAAR